MATPNANTAPTPAILQPGSKAVMSDECSVNLGSLYETAVAMELKAHGYHLYYYDNKSKGEVAYTMFDVEEQASEEIINMLRAIPGVFRVRVVK